MQRIATFIVAIYMSPILLFIYCIGLFKRYNKITKYVHKDFKYVNMPSIATGYETNLLFTNGYINTVVSELFRVLRRREIPEQNTFLLTSDDGGIFSIHVYTDSLVDDKTPTMILFHGLCGGYYASYMKSFAYAYRKSGYRVVKVNARGCADYGLNSKVFFCATHTKDHKLAIETVSLMFPSSKLFACAFSLGANILFHYLEENPTTPLTACIAYSVAFNIPAVERHLSTFIPKYTTNFVLAVFIKQFLYKNKAMFDFLDWKSIDKSTTLQELDEQVVVKVFNYSSLKEYYKAADCSRCVKHVTIPFLVVNAEDDLVCPKHTIAFKEIKENPNVALVLTQYGGHVGWAPAIPNITKDSLIDQPSLPYFQNSKFNINPLLTMTNSWSEQVAVEFIDQFVQ